MKIRQATYEDLDALMEIFAAAKQIMRASGNLQQWNDGYPSREVVMRDIDGGHCYVMCESAWVDGQTAGAECSSAGPAEHGITSQTGCDGQGPAERISADQAEHGITSQTDCDGLGQAERISADPAERIIGTMALIPGPDPTYSYIEGEWPGDEPYYVIHRIATAAPGRNVARVMLDWAFEHIRREGQVPGRCFASTDPISTIRIDTHRDNCIMKHILTKYGFTMCGVIYLADGAPRDAYYLQRHSATLKFSDM